MASKKTQKKQKLCEELTLEDAIKLCRRLWLWLVKNEDAEKSEWVGWKAISKKYGCREFYHSCPCCEFVIRSTDFVATDHRKLNYCKKGLCPLAGYAWGHNSFACLKENSPFERWEEGNLEEGNEGAKKIAKACKDAMNDLKNEQFRKYPPIKVAKKRVKK